MFRMCLKKFFVYNFKHFNTRLVCRNGKHFYYTIIEIVASKCTWKISRDAGKSWEKVMEFDFEKSLMNPEELLTIVFRYDNAVHYRLIKK